MNGAGRAVDDPALAQKKQPSLVEAAAVLAEIVAVAETER
jgi:hypothetical protein